MMSAPLVRKSVLTAMGEGEAVTEEEAVEVGEMEGEGVSAGVDD